MNRAELAHDEWRHKTREEYLEIGADEIMNFLVAIDGASDETLLEEARKLREDFSRFMADEFSKAKDAGPGFTGELHYHYRGRGI